MSGMSRVLFLMILMWFLPGSTPAQKGASDADSLRHARLAGLGRLWGVVHFQHPYLAEGIWDEAVAKSIARLDTLGSREAYKSMVDTLLGVLNDPFTVGAWHNQGFDWQLQSTHEIPEKQPAFEWWMPEENGEKYAVVKLTDYAQIANPPLSEVNAALQKIAIEIMSAGGATGVIFDLRRRSRLIVQHDPVEQVYGPRVVRFLSLFLTADLETDGSSSRYYSGYPDQYAIATPNADVNPFGFLYYSGRFNKSPQTVQAGFSSLESLTKASLRAIGISRMVFLINPASTGLDMVLGAFKEGGARIIQVDLTPRPIDPLITRTIDIGDSLYVRVRLSDMINVAGETVPNILPSYIMSIEDGVGPQAIDAAGYILQGHNDPPPNAFKPKIPHRPAISSDVNPVFADAELPSAEYRILALYKFWNVIYYLYPYTDGLNWGGLLEALIPSFKKADTWLEYVIEVAKLTSLLQDSHGNVSHGFDAEFYFDQYLGAYYPPILVDFVQPYDDSLVTDIGPASRTMVSYVGKDPSKMTFVDSLGAPSPVGLNPLDVITAVNKTPIWEKISVVRKITPVSTGQAFYGDARVEVLRSKTPRLELAVIDTTGTEKTVYIEIHGSGDYDMYSGLPVSKPDSIARVGKSKNIGYINLGRVSARDIEVAFSLFADTPWIIIDARDYPNFVQEDLGRVIGKYLTRNDIAATHISTPILAADASSRETVKRYTQYLYADPKKRFYAGRTAVLINSGTISASEEICLYLKAARQASGKAKVTFLGQPTVGANGNVTNMKLPGDLYITFTGLGVESADGTPLQRVGIQPDIRIGATIQDIMNRHDVILSRTIERIEDGRMP